MVFALLNSYLDLKVFIDYDKMRAFFLDHGVPQEKLPNNRKVAGTTFGTLIPKHKIIVIWIDEEYSSGLYNQSVIAHESVHVISKILHSLEIREALPEEAYAQIMTRVYIEIAQQLIALGVDFNKPKPHDKIAQANALENNA